MSSPSKKTKSSPKKSRAGWVDRISTRVGPANDVGFVLNDENGRELIYIGGRSDAVQIRLVCGDSNVVLSLTPDRVVLRTGSTQEIDLNLGAAGSPFMLNLSEQGLFIGTPKTSTVSAAGCGDGFAFIDGKLCPIRVERLKETKPRRRPRKRPERKTK